MDGPWTILGMFLFATAVWSHVRSGCHVLFIKIHICLNLKYQAVDEDTGCMQWQVYSGYICFLCPVSDPSFISGFTVGQIGSQCQGSLGENGFGQLCNTDMFGKANCCMPIKHLQNNII